MEDKLNDKEVEEIIKKFSRKNNPKAQHIKEVGNPKTKSSKKTRTVKIGIRLVETRLGKRVLIEQTTKRGTQRVWLRESDIVQLLNVLTSELFGGREEELDE